MLSTTPVLRSARLALALPLLVISALVPLACGDDSTDTASSGSSSNESGSKQSESSEESEGYELLSDAEVAEGLASSEALLGTMVADPSSATDDTLSELFEGWEAYEGAIKKQRAETYLALEDALASFKKAANASDGDAMAKAAGDFAKEATAYLVVFPG